MTILVLSASNAAFAHGSNDNWWPLVWILGGVLLFLLLQLAVFVYGIVAFMGFWLAFWLAWSLGSGWYLAQAFGATGENFPWMFVLAKVPAEFALCLLVRRARKAARVRQSEIEAEAADPEEALRRQKVLAGRDRPQGSS